VNGIEKELRGRARVVRLNLLSGTGREVAMTHGVRSVPTTLVFDRAGKEVYRHAGIPNRKHIVALASGS